MTGKLSTMVLAVVMSLMLITMGYIVASSITMSAPIIIYASASTTALTGVNYKSFSPTVPSANGTWLVGVFATSADLTGVNYMGNSSVVQLAGGIRSIDDATWAVTYYASSNVSDKAKIQINATIVDIDGTIIETLATEEATSAYIQTGNGTYTATVDVTGVDVNQTLFLKVDWLALKVDDTNQTVSLMLDSGGTGGGNFTKIAALAITYGLPIFLGGLMMLVGIVVLFGIVIYTVKSVFKKQK